MPPVGPVCKQPTPSRDRMPPNQPVDSQVHWKDMSDAVPICGVGWQSDWEQVLQHSAASGGSGSAVESEGESVDTHVEHSRQGGRLDELLSSSCGCSEDSSHATPVACPRSEQHSSDGDGEALLLHLERRVLQLVDSAAVAVGESIHGSYGEQVAAAAATNEQRLTSSRQRYSTVDTPSCAASRAATWLVGQACHADVPAHATATMPEFASVPPRLRELANAISTHLDRLQVLCVSQRKEMRAGYQRTVAQLRQHHATSTQQAVAAVEARTQAAIAEAQHMAQNVAAVELDESLHSVMAPLRTELTTLERCNASLQEALEREQQRSAALLEDRRIATEQLRRSEELAVQRAEYQEIRLRDELAAQAAEREHELEYEGWRQREALHTELGRLMEECARLRSAAISHGQVDGIWCGQVGVVAQQMASGGSSGPVPAALIPPWAEAVRTPRKTSSSLPAPVAELTPSAVDWGTVGDVQSGEAVGVGVAAAEGAACVPRPRGAVDCIAELTRLPPLPPHLLLPAQDGGSWCPPGSASRCADAAVEPPVFGPPAGEPREIAAAVVQRALSPDAMSGCVDAMVRGVDVLAMGSRSASASTPTVNNVPPDPTVGRPLGSGCDVSAAQQGELARAPAPATATAPVLVGVLEWAHIDKGQVGSQQLRMETRSDMDGIGVAACKDADVGGDHLKCREGEDSSGNGSLVADPSVCSSLSNRLQRLLAHGGLATQTPQPTFPSRPARPVGGDDPASARALSPSALASSPFQSIARDPIAAQPAADPSHADPSWGMESFSIASPLPSASHAFRRRQPACRLVTSTLARCEEGAVPCDSSRLDTMRMDSMQHLVSRGSPDASVASNSRRSNYAQLLDEYMAQGHTLQPRASPGRCPVVGSPARSAGPCSRSTSKLATTWR